MRGRVFLVALLIIFGAGAWGWAGPFAQVPASDRAYRDCAYLAQRGLVKPPPGGAFTARQPLTRTDFALALLPPARALAGGQGSPDDRVWLRGLLAGLPPEEVGQVATRMARLIARFQPEFELMGQEVKAALAEAKRLAATPPQAKPQTPVWRETHSGGGEPAAGLHYRLSGAELGVTYSRTSPDQAPLAYLPTWNLVRAAQRPAASRLAPGGAPGEYATKDLSVRSVRGTVEYGLTRGLTLSLAYQALVHEGYGLTPLDDTSLKTVGLGYRLSPSTSVRLRYHLIDYRERLASTGRQRDELAETELVIRF